MTVRSHDFRSLRSWDGSQHRAFEELCYQLRDPTPGGAELVKTGDPDGGVEWYVTLRGGTQWGWQATYTFDVGTLLTLMERSLKTVVRERPPCRKLTFCIPFDLPDAPGVDERKSARQKFENRKESWRSRIPGADRVHIELWCGGDLLERLVGHPSQRGMERFFWDREVFAPDWCADQVARTILAAPGRYSPELHVDLPIAFALEGLARSEAYWQKYRQLRGAVAVAANRIDGSHYTGLGVTNEMRRLGRCSAEWQLDVPNRVNLPMRLRLDRLLELSAAFRRAVNEARPSDLPRRKTRATTRQTTRRRTAEFASALPWNVASCDRRVRNFPAERGFCGRRAWGVAADRRTPARARHICSATLPSVPHKRGSRLSYCWPAACPGAACGVKSLTNLGLTMPAVKLWSGRCRLRRRRPMHRSSC